MRRKFAALMTALAFAACVGRVSAWASSDTTHACCHGASSTPAKEVSIIDCCPTAATANKVEIVRSDLIAVLAEIPTVTAHFFIHAARIAGSPSRDSQTFYSATPARAPPLA